MIKKAQQRTFTRKAALSRELYKLAESIDGLADAIEADAKAVFQQEKIASRQAVTDYGTVSTVTSGAASDDFVQWCLS